MVKGEPLFIITIILVILIITGLIVWDVFDSEAIIPLALLIGVGLAISLLIASGGNKIISTTPIQEFVYTNERLFIPDNDGILNRYYYSKQLSMKVDKISVVKRT